MAKPAIRIGHLAITDHLILGVTKDKLDKEEERFNHLDLVVETRNDWTKVATGLETGEMDGAFVLAPIAMDLFNSGVGMRLVLFTHKTGSILVKSKHADIKKVEDFQGKSILVPYQRSVHNMLFHKLMKEHGLLAGPGGMEGVDVVVEVVPPAMMNDFLMYDEDGEIGGFIVAEPIGSKAISGGYAEEMYLSKDLWPDHPCCVLMMRDEIIRKHPDAVQELTNSLVRSGTFIEENPDAAAAIGASFLGQDQALIKSVLTEPVDRIKTGDLLPVLDDLEAMQDYMVNNMNILNRKVDLERFVDMRFAEEACNPTGVQWGGAPPVPEVGGGGKAAEGDGRKPDPEPESLGDSGVELAEGEGVARVTLARDLTGGASLAFTRVLDELAAKSGPEVVLDFHKVETMDTRALRALVVFPDLRKRNRADGKLTVVGLGKSLQPLFEAFPLNTAYGLED